jgi:hypothetical protein
MPKEDHPANMENMFPQPRRWGAQFHTDPNFFLNTEIDEWVANPAKTITEGAMLGGVINDIISSAGNASEAVPEMGFPTKEELTGTIGAVTLSSLQEMLPIIANQYVMEGPQGNERMQEVEQARDLGLQGAREWWAGNVVNAGGGGHVPRSAELPPLQFSGRKFEADPHLINTDTTFEGAKKNYEKFGVPTDVDPNEFIKQMVTPISETDIIKPEDITDPDLWDENPFN